MFLLFGRKRSELTRTDQTMMRYFIKRQVKRSMKKYGIPDTQANRLDMLYRTWANMSKPTDMVPDKIQQTSLMIVEAEIMRLESEIQ